MSIAAVVADFVQKLERDIDAAEAAGKPTKQMRDERDALIAMLKRMHMTCHAGELHKSPRPGPT